MILNSLQVSRTEYCAKRNILASILSLVAAFSITYAGNTGKISGTITDSQTKEALIGVNVVIEGTSLGAATNIDGYYVILNIPPGKYTLSASAVGYNKRGVSGVSVSIDLTTTIDFDLPQTVLEVGEEVVVIAQRPLVQRDLTAKTAVVGGDQISALPVTEVGQVLSLQAGFTAQGNLRGGRSGEVAYWIDGVPVTDGYNGQQVVEVNKNLVQELQLISGAFNAEFGQALSGIVNIATKEGGVKFAGGVGAYGGQYVTNDNGLFPGLDKFKPTSIRNIEGNLSGPIFGDNLTFFVNGRYINFDGWLKGIRRFNPQNFPYVDSTGTFYLSKNADGKGDSAIVPMNSSERSYAQAKLTWHITPVMKLTGNYIYDHTKSRPYTTLSDHRTYFLNPDGFGNDYNTSNTFIAQFTHTLSSNTFYTLGASLFEKKFKYYLYEDIHDPRYVHPILATTIDSYSFLTGSTDLSRTNRSTTTFLAKLDLSSQINSTNLIKIGGDFTKYRAFYEYMTLQPSVEQTSIDLSKDSPYIRTRVLDLSSNSHDMYTHQPTEFSFYAQDKMEFKDIIVNIGVRYDYFDPDGVVLTDETDPNIYRPIRPNNRFFDLNGNGIQDPGERDKTVDDRTAYWYRKASAKWQISPRLGVSFPITDRGIVHFSYGHFFQTPRFERLYENPQFKIGTGTSGVIGNADLDPEQTIKGELGVQQQLTEDISGDLTVYVQDIRSLTGTQGQQIVVFRGAEKYSKYTNSDFGLVKGIVLTLNKRFSGGFNATLDYTYQVAKGSASDPKDARNAVTGGKQPEIQLNSLGWDQRQTLNVTLAYSAQSWGISSIAQYGSGTPYTPRATTDISSLLTNSQLKPSFFNLDLRAYYEVPVNPLKLVFFARVFNLFDIRNEVNVFDDTGRAGFTTDESTALASRPPQLVNTIDQWFLRPLNYSEPRRIEFGLNLEF